MSFRYSHQSPPRTIVGESSGQFKSAQQRTVGNPYVSDNCTCPMSLYSRARVTCQEFPLEDVAGPRTVLRLAREGTLTAGQQYSFGRLLFFQVSEVLALRRRIQSTSRLRPGPVLMIAKSKNDSTAMKSTAPGYQEKSDVAGGVGKSPGNAAATGETGKKPAQ